jgi:hypothetical protein
MTENYNCKATISNAANLKHDSIMMYRDLDSTTFPAHQFYSFISGRRITWDEDTSQSVVKSTAQDLLLRKKDKDHQARRRRRAVPGYSKTLI